MIIIGEKINGSIPKVKKAIQEKDDSFIFNLAVKQAEAGADYIDICASTAPEEEIDTLIWLMSIVQEATEKPLCIDSPNPKVIEAVFKYAKTPGIINSVSEENEKSELIYKLVQGTQWSIIALTCDSKGIPDDVARRVEIAKILVEKAHSYNITPDRIHIDPLIMALATDNNSFVKFIEILHCIKKVLPAVKVTTGLSNISFGLPLRKIINKSFLTIAVFAGLDSAIMDPCDKEMMATVLATEALLGLDKHCRIFTNAYRKGKIG